MNKYRINVILIFMLSLAVCTTQTRHSRKRYSKKKHANSTINTLIDLNTVSGSNSSLNLKQVSPVSALPVAAQNMFAAPKAATEIIDTYVPLSEEKKLPAPLFEEEDEEESIEFNFEHADLQNFIKQIEEIFEVTFISDDALQPLPQGKKAVKGNKISFKTHAPLSKKEAWNLFLSFLDIAGFAVINHTDPKVFRITTIES